MSSARGNIVVSFFLLAAIGLFLDPACLRAAVASSDRAGKDRAVSVEPVSPAQPSCSPAPLPVPPTPSKIPGYTELDPSTGLHVTGTMQSIDVTRYRLEVTGKVARPLKLGYDEIRCMPRVSGRPALVCVGFFTDTALWAGVPLKHLIDLAGAKPGATGVRITGADSYEVTLPMGVATAAGSFIAYEWEGKALPRLHGFPLRAVFSGQEGNRWVKWITKIEVY